MSQKVLLVGLEPDVDRVTRTVELGRFFAHGSDGKSLGSIAFSARIVCGRGDHEMAEGLDQFLQDAAKVLAEWQTKQVEVWAAMVEEREVKS